MNTPRLTMNRPGHWPTDATLELLHGPGRCPTCRGRQWVATPDPLYPNELIDVRCPTCIDRARTP